jgi:hypothetical protein
MRARTLLPAIAHPHHRAIPLCNLLLSLPSSATVHYWVVPSNLPQSENFIAELNTEEYFKKLPFSEMYNISKLLDVFLARKIAALPVAQDIQVTVTNPGLCRSAFRDDFGAVLAWCVTFFPTR